MVSDFLAVAKMEEFTDESDVIASCWLLAIDSFVTLCNTKFLIAVAAMMMYYGHFSTDIV